jgi:DNA-binding XRE family transcriptional regulator
MSYWIADALIQAREDVGLEPKQMATILGVHEHTINRLESGQSMGRDIDSATAAYADVTGIGDARELWWAALYFWYQRGSAPAFTAEGPAAAFAEAIRAASLRLQPSAGGRSGKPISIPAPPWLARRNRRLGQ